MHTSSCHRGDIFPILEHTKGLSKDKITDDVEGDVVEPGKDVKPRTVVALAEVTVP